MLAFLSPARDHARAAKERPAKERPAKERPARRGPAKERARKKEGPQRRGPPAKERAARKGEGPQRSTRSRATGSCVFLGSSKEAARKRMESEISPELTRTGPWALGPRLGGGLGPWAHGPLSKKIE